MNISRLASTALFLAMAHWASGADTLQWDSTRTRLEVLPGQDSVATDFRFHNTGAYPVRITDIETSCPCTAATASRTLISPGETGVIHAVFEAGKLSGLVTKIVKVTTDQVGTAPTELLLDVNIQQYVSVEPRLINWRMGGDTSERTISCSARSAHRISLTAVTCSMPDIVIKVSTLEPGRRYFVRLIAGTRSSHDTAVIQLKVDVDGVGTQVINAYAYFK